MRKDFISMGLFLFVFASECFANKITDDFNRNWQFTLSDSACYSFINYKTDSWRNVNLPHILIGRGRSLEPSFEYTEINCPGFASFAIFSVLNHIS